MKVYVLVESDWDYGIVRSVSSSKEKAMEALPAWKKTSAYASFQIEEWDVDSLVVGKVWTV